MFMHGAGDGRPSRVERRILHSPLTECIWINCHFSHSSLCVVPRATSNSLCLFAAKTCSCTLTGDHRAWSDAYCTPFLIYFSRTLSTQKILNSFMVIWRTSRRYTGIIALTEYMSINFQFSCPYLCVVPRAISCSLSLFAAKRG